LLMQPKNCVEEKIVLEGRLEIAYDKYPITVLSTKEKNIWLYEPPNKFDEYLNKTVRIKGILSPAHSEDMRCKICFRECPTCQCPLNEPLLYDVEILEVF